MEKEKVQSPEREMCSLCHIFWGSKEAKGMCSKCFKEHLLTSEISSRAKRQTVEQDKHEYLPAPVMKNPGQMEENIIDEGDILPQQKDTKRCWNCNRKVGYLGFPCKCKYIFCAKHRHPEEHQCQFDFMTEGRLMLKKQCPAVVPQKMEKI